MYVAEDGLEVPPAPDVFGPRRLVRYRREYLADLRAQGERRSEEPSLAPAGDVLSLQERFAALSAMGSIGSLDWDEEFRRYIEGEGTAAPFRHEDLLDSVRAEIMGGSSSTAARPDLVVNPAHLSGLSNADLTSQAYDDTLFGPVTTGVDLVVGRTSTPSSDSAAGSSSPAQVSEDMVPEQTKLEQAEAEETNVGQASPELTSPEPADWAAANEEADRLPEARPVRAADAHGLDLSGLDEKPPRSGRGGRTALVILLVLVLLAAVVLGLLFFL